MIHMSRKKKLPPNVRERNGRYTYRYSVEVVEDGIKRRKQKETPSYATPTEAYQTGVLIKAQQIQGTYVDEKDITFGTWADQWLEMYEQLGKKDHTVYTRKSAVNRLKKEFGPLKLKDITPLQYQSYLYKLKKKGRKKNTVLNLHTTMVMIVRKAYRPPLELIAKDFTVGIEFPSFKDSLQDLKNSKLKVKYFEKEELAHFIKTTYEIAKEAETPKERLAMRQCARALHILAFTGMRIGELCALEIGDIDSKEKKINIIKTLNVQHGIENFILDTPKNETSIREVDMTDKVVALFKEQKREVNEFKLSMGNTLFKETPFVFINMNKKTGCPLSPLEIARYMTDVLKRTDLPKDLTPHKLRHTYTSLMAEAGVELAAIQRQLGHANDRITTQIYLHVTKAKRKTNVEKFEALMDGLI
ncbi:Transposase [compost metagenome]